MPAAQSTGVKRAVSSRTNDPKNGTASSDSTPPKQRKPNNATIVTDAITFRPITLQVYRWLFTFLIKFIQYWQFCEIEESESESRTQQQDEAIFSDCCAQIRTTLVHIRDEARKKTDGEMDKKSGDVVSLGLMALRRLHRLAQFRIRKMRDRVQSERIRVEERYLALQNVNHEIAHLHKEADRCYEFKSADEDIELISIDEFYATAPETIAKPEITKNNEHALRLARLTWEMQQRQSLARQLLELQERQNVMVTDISAKEQRLDSLQPLIETILEATGVSITSSDGRQAVVDCDDEEWHPVDIAQCLNYFEIEENDANTHTQQHYETAFSRQCEQLRSALGAHLGGNSRSTLIETMNRATIGILALRRIYRLAHYRCRIVDDRRVQAERDKYEERYLHLQMMNQEVDCLHREAERCLEFKSADESIEMISIDDFNKLAPEYNRQLTTKEQHEQRLARLRLEMRQRQLLAKQLKQLEERRTEIAADIVDKEQQLESLKRMIENILEAAKPVRDFMGIRS